MPASLTPKTDATFVASLLDRLVSESTDDIVANSLANYCVPGFYSLMLLRSPALNLRLYVSKPFESQMHRALDPADNTLWIHDHRFYFQCQTLIGEMRNLRFEEGDDSIGARFGPGWYKYAYSSGLTSPDGKMHLQGGKRVALSLVETELVPAGESYGMSPWQLHRICVPNDRLVALLFWEHTRMRRGSYMYSNEPLPQSPSMAGRYTPMTEGDVLDIAQLVVDYLPR